VMPDAPILVTGSSGLLGMDLVEVLAEAGPVVPMTHQELDITDKRQVMARLREIRPRVVVNCAAFTRVDECEAREEEARRVNAHGPSVLAAATHRLGATLVHISTDYVFDGLRTIPQPYGEEESPHPLSAYGRTKWEGEQAVRATTPNHLIVRTAWLYGRHGRSFPKAILAQALRGAVLRVVDDQYGSPTWSRSLARQIRVLIGAGVTGTVHATSQGHCSWFTFARSLLARLDIDAEVSPCPSPEYPRPAPRPTNSILENRRLRALGLHRMDSWESDLERFVAEHGETIRKEAAA